MKATKEVLNSINFKSMTTFKEDGGLMLVIEVDNGSQAKMLLDILSNNKFSLRIDKTNGKDFLIILFKESGLFRKNPISDTLISNFKNKEIKWLSTGFDMNGDLATLSNRIDMEDMNPFSLN